MGWFRLFFYHSVRVGANYDHLGCNGYNMTLFLNIVQPTSHNEDECRSLHLELRKTKTNEKMMRMKWDNNSSSNRCKIPRRMVTTGIWGDKESGIAHI